MNNLFILHTQYNLIIGSGIALRNKEDNNILVLYPEFATGPEIMKNLKKVFSQVILIREKFADNKTGLEEAFQIRSYVKKTKAISKIKFDRIFVSQERRLDTLLAYRFAKQGQCTINHIEEDVYYSLTQREQRKEKRTLKGALGNCVRTAICGKNPFYESGNVCYGSNKMYDAVYALYPELVRDEVVAPKRVEVTEEILTDGIRALYADRNCSYPEGEKYLVLFFDLLDRYKNKEKVIELSKVAIERAASKNIKVLAKYHPRETEKLEGISEITEIDKIIPGEKVLLDLREKDVTVFGNATTVCEVAAKLGCRVMSIAKIDHADNSQMHEVMEKMGIELIRSENEINLMI